MKNEHDFGGKFSRRRMLLLAGAGVCAAVAAPMPVLLQSAHAGTGKAQGKKTLIVFFSRSGNTRTMAEHIRALTGGDMLELHPATPYPEAYKAVTEQAKAELASGYLPPLKTSIPDMAAYGVVFVGSPSWWATLAPPVQSFLTGRDLSGKTVAPFVTHEGSGLGKSAQRLIQLCPGATIPQGLALRGSTVSLSRNKVEAWLREIGLQG